MPAWAPSTNSVGRGAAAADFFPVAHIDAHQDAHHDFIFGGGMDSHHGDPHHHMATAHVGPIGEVGGGDSGVPFDIPPDSVLDAMKAVLEGQEEEMKATHRAKLEGLKVPPYHAPEPMAGMGPPGGALPVHPDDLRMATSGFHLDMMGPLKIMKTAVLVTGGMCSKLFGLGMMGFLVFQSFKSNAAQQAQDEQKQQQQQQSPYQRLQCQQGCCS